jgi:hypothetical protein
MFDSKKEAEYYLYLLYEEKIGNIERLRLHPAYILLNAFVYNGTKERKITYVADFEYIEKGLLTVVDVKGFKTDIYKLKRKLFLSKYGHYISFKEI